MVERWKLIEDGKKLEVRITIEDQDTFNQPWQAMLRWSRAAGELPENHLRPRTICIRSIMVCRSQTNPGFLKGSTA